MTKFEELAVKLSGRITLVLLRLFLRLNYVIVTVFERVLRVIFKKAMKYSREEFSELLFNSAVEVLLGYYIRKTYLKYLQSLDEYVIQVELLPTSKVIKEEPRLLYIG